MADPLTLSVMSQIVRKAGGKDPRPEPTQDYQDAGQPQGQPHLTDRQAVLLSELIQKKKTASGPVKTGTQSQRTEGTLSLDALVKSAKNR